MKNTQINHNLISKIANLLVDSSIQRMVEAGVLVDDSIPSLLGEERFGVLNVLPQERGDDIQWLREQFLAIVPLEQVSKIRTYSTANGVLLHIPGVCARDSPSFEALFQSLPDGKFKGGYLEIGEWNRQTDSYPWEDSVDLQLGPDGQVWALVGSLDQIPDSPD